MTGHDKANDWLCVCYFLPVLYIPVWLSTDELSHNLRTCQASWIFTTPALYNTVVDGVARANITLKVHLLVVHCLSAEFQNGSWFKFIVLILTE